MPLKPRFCSQCGQAVATRVVDDRPRTVCSACETVFYENPLPVAASILLNDRREVLLVKRKRDPHRGKWCLPMGFAEMGETIAEAALRELREETHVQARVLRLVDADSFDSDFYGDLLIVTFELEKIGGHERPGDDAEDVRYFPIARRPQLAFISNEKALSVCAAAHREEWAIHDSFLTLQSAKDKAMLSDPLVTLIGEQAEQIARLWLAEVRSGRTTRSHSRIDENELLERGKLAVSQFGRWLKGDAGADEVRDFYRHLAKERRAQGFSAHELLSSLTLLKKHIWTFARTQGVWERPIDVYRVLELNRRMAAFFDRAIYHSVRAFDTDA